MFNESEILDPGILRTAKADLFRNFTILMGAAGIMYGAFSAYFGWYPLALISFLFATISLLNVSLLHLQLIAEEVGHYSMVLVGMTFPILFQVYAGGLFPSGMVMIWAVVTVLVVYIILPVSIGKLGTLYLAAVFVFGVYYDPAIMTDGQPLIGAQFQKPLMLANFAFVSLICGAILTQYFKARDESLAALNKLRIKLSDRKEVLEESLRYAKRLQKALTPDLGRIQFILKDHFQFIHQKEHVGGDMIWMGHQGDQVIIAVLDCTGHGVPGSMLTVIANDILNETVHFMDITDPATIAERLLIVMNARLESENTMWSDSADIGVLTFDRINGSVKFSGAGVDLIKYTKEKGIEFIKGQSTVIGLDHLANRIQKTVPVSVDLKGTKFFMASDGLVDLFGGPEHKRFGKNRLLDLLGRIQDMPFELQRRMIINDIFTWKGEEPATDDISIIGLELSEGFLNLSESDPIQLSA